MGDKYSYLKRLEYRVPDPASNPYLVFPAVLAAGLDGIKNKTEPVILNAGQMSLHHPKIVHGSGVNKSKERRMGFVIQSYIGSNVDQVLGKIYVQQARGNDTFNYHEHVERPKKTMDDRNVNIRKNAMDELSKIFYTGLKDKGKF